MKIRLHHSESGIALVLVMTVLFVLAILAGGFAYAMRVEMRLARNHDGEEEMEWLGRSGVELGKYVLAQQGLIPSEPYDALNQKWAGGIGVTNEALAEIDMENNALGNGTFSIQIIDQERKFNINAADQIILQRAINLVGIDAAESGGIIDSILDWRDPDDNPHLNGTESDYYLSLDPPYFAKNGPIDDIAELSLIRGVTPEIYWGPTGTNSDIASTTHSSSLLAGVSAGPSAGLYHLFSAISGRLVNINTAPSAVLQLLPGIDETIANGIVQARAGPDGVEGTEDDTPFRTAGELINVPGLSAPQVGGIARYCSTRSTTFEIHVFAQIGSYQREYVAMVRRNNPRDIQTLFFYWK